MGGPGSGRAGGARDAGGRFTIEGAIAITTAEAVADVERLEGKVDELTGATDQNSAALDENSQALEKNTNEKKENTTETGKGVDAIDGHAVNLQIATSALNQATGALMKMTGGLEAAGIISQETSQDWQKNIRILEIFTGALEFALVVTMLLNFAGYSLTTAMAGVTAQFWAATAATSAFAAASWAAMLPWLPLIILVTAVVGLLVILQMQFDFLGKGIGMLNSGVGIFVDLLSDAAGLVTGLTSSIGSLGDAFTDNPVTKLISKAGGGIF